MQARAQSHTRVKKQASTRIQKGSRETTTSESRNAFVPRCAIARRAYSPLHARTELQMRLPSHASRDGRGQGPSGVAGGARRRRWSG
eukprot:2986594-Pleurochrysis_carterae.AAC.2